MLIENLKLLLSHPGTGFAIYALGFLAQTEIHNWNTKPMITMFWLVIGGVIATWFETWIPVPRLYLRGLVLIFAIGVIAYSIAARVQDTATNPIQLPTSTEVIQSFSDFVEKMKVSRSSLADLKGFAAHNHFEPPNDRIHVVEDFSRDSLNKVLMFDLPNAQIEELALEMTQPSMSRFEAIFLHGTRSGLALLKRADFPEPDPDHIISFNVGRFWSI